MVFSKSSKYPETGRETTDFKFTLGGAFEGLLEETDTTVQEP